MIKTAVIGYGLSAQVFHLPFLTRENGFQCVAVSTSRGHDVAERYPDVKVYASAEELLARTDAELVIITSPNTTHEPLARLALTQQKHVVLEKPFVTSVSSGEELIRLAKHHDRQLAVYHNRRWDDDFQAIERIIASGKIGRVRVFESSFDRFRPEIKPGWREQPGPGSGVLFDLGSHLIDQALTLFGMPTWVCGRVACLREEARTHDYFMLQLQYDTVEVILRHSPFNGNRMVRFRVQGDQGSAMIYGLDGQEERLRRQYWGEAPSAGSSPNEHICLLREVGSETERPYEMPLGDYGSFYRQLHAALDAGADLPVTADQALDTIRVMEAAVVSQEEQRTVAVNT